MNQNKHETNTDNVNQNKDETNTASVNHRHLEIHQNNVYGLRVITSIQVIMKYKKKIKCLPPKLLASLLLEIPIDEGRKPMTIKEILAKGDITYKTLENMIERILIKKGLIPPNKKSI